MSDIAARLVPAVERGDRDARRTHAAAGHGGCKPCTIVVCYGGGVSRARRPDRDARAIMDALRRIVRALRQSARLTEARLGISAAQLFVLHEVATAGAESINALAERTLTDQSSVSLVVTRLERRGLVVRRDAPDDRRRTAVAATAAGRRLLGHAPE